MTALFGSAEPQWHTYDEDKNIRFQVISTENKKYKIASDRYKRILERQDAQHAQSGKIDLTVSDDEVTVIEVGAELAARYLLVGWDGVKDEDGNPLTFSFENAYNYLLKNIEAYVFIFAKAQQMAIDAIKEQAETEKK